MDFRETAAVLANCDLLISSDSAVVHLAGAMGIPVGCPAVDSRMAMGIRRGSKTAWYDSIRLFRQPRDGHWGPVIEAMITAWMQMIKA